MMTGNTIIVAGFGGLLGAQLTAYLLKNQNRVIAFDREVNQSSERLKSLGVDIDHNSLDLYELDITQEADVKVFFQALIDQKVKIDGAVNATYPRNSTYGKSFFEVSLENFNENVNLHLGSAFLFMRECANYFETLKTAFSLVNVASIYGVVAPNFDVYKNTNMTMPVEYAAIKSAILHLSKYTASYINNSDFRVNSVSPGGIFDNQPEKFLDAYKSQTHGSGMLDVTSVLGGIEFLLSSQSKYMTGQNIVIDDGFTL